MAQRDPRIRVKRNNFFMGVVGIEGYFTIRFWAAEAGV